MKIRIDLSQELKDIEGKSMGEIPAADVVVEAILQQSDGPPLKLLSICQELKEGKQINLSIDDYNLVTGIIEKDRRLTVMAKARILEAFEAGRIAKVGKS